MRTTDATDYLETLSEEQIDRLYKESQLDDGEVKTDYVAGYWAMFAGWPKPSRYNHAEWGWLDAIRDAAWLISSEIYTIRETPKQIVVYSGTQGGERHMRHFQKTEKGRAAANRHEQRLKAEGYSFVTEGLFDTLISHGRKKEAQ